MPRIFRKLLSAAQVILVVISLPLPVSAATGAAPAPPVSRYWKGNLHTHTLWSDGDDFPEMVADWYKNHGYQFLALSDHNLIQYGQKWMDVASLQAKEETLTRYIARFGVEGVEQRVVGHRTQVRLSTLGEVQTRLQDAGRFLLIPASELTSNYKIWPVHINASNLRSALAPVTGISVLDTMQKTVDAVLYQRAATGQPMMPHVNHPNFGWAITAEDLAEVRGEKFFEVYNGHPETHSRGDGTRVSVEQIWDVVLAIRLSRQPPFPIYGLATDDAHRYHRYAENESNPGRGWVMVRSPRLEAADLINAMERGDFYASTGVELLDVRRDRRSLTVRVKPDRDTTFTIRFVGTPKNYNRSSEPIIAKDGRPYATTRRYSPEVGMVFREDHGLSATYTFEGHELYVRAVVISSKKKESGSSPQEMEQAWTQPLVWLP